MKNIQKDLSRALEKARERDLEQTSKRTYIFWDLKEVYYAVVHFFSEWSVLIKLLVVYTQLSLWFPRKKKEKVPWLWNQKKVYFLGYSSLKVFHKKAQLGRVYLGESSEQLVDLDSLMGRCCFAAETTLYLKKKNILPHDSTNWLIIRFQKMMWEKVVHQKNVWSYFKGRSVSLF